MTVQVAADGVENVKKQAREFVLLLTLMTWAAIVSWTTPTVKLISCVHGDAGNIKSIAMFGPLFLWAMLYVLRFLRGSNTVLLGPKTCGVVGCAACGFQTIASGGIMQSPLISGIGIVVLLAASMSEKREDRNVLYAFGCGVIVLVAVASFALKGYLTFVGTNNANPYNITTFAAIPVVALLLDRAMNINNEGSPNPAVVAS